MAFHWLKIFVRCYATVRMDFTNTFGEVTRIPFDIIVAVFFRHADQCCKKRECITGTLTQILGQCPGSGVTMPRNNID